MKNFNGQWIEIFAAGQHADNTGRAHTIDPAFLESVVANFNADTHTPPIVVGHPADNTPAFGWAEELRRNGDKLEARFSDVDPQFESMVKDGRFKKRSASFYVDPATAPGGKAPVLKHVGFLGATAPAVKGLKDIRFSEAEAITYELNFSEGNMNERNMDEQSLANKIIDGLKSLFKKDEGAVSSFSEADLTKKIADAVTAATAPLTASFNEQITALKNENKSLRESVNNQSSKVTRTEIVAFTEKLGLARFPPAFKAMGVIEFMESLSAIPSDSKVTVIEFTEKDGVKTETGKKESTPLQWFQNFMEAMPSFIQFGERFGGLHSAGADAATAVTAERMNELREKAGIEVKK